MFTGIINHIGYIDSLKLDSKKDALLKISTDKNKIKRDLQIGCSIACNGICLTLIEKKISSKKLILSFCASEETCHATNLLNWKIGASINLEFALKVGDDLDGHFVLGHVDGKAKIKDIEQIKNSQKFTFILEKSLMKFIIPKGSVAINGVSLTINEVTKNSFSVNILQYSFKNTSFCESQKGDLVNIEIDVIARYCRG